MVKVRYSVIYARIILFFLIIFAMLSSLSATAVFCRDGDITFAADSTGFCMNVPPDMERGGYEFLSGVSGSDRVVRGDLSLFPLMMYGGRNGTHIMPVRESRVRFCTERVSLSVVLRC